MGKFQRVSSLEDLCCDGCRDQRFQSCEKSINEVTSFQTLAKTSTRDLQRNAADTRQTDRTERTNSTALPSLPRKIPFINDGQELPHHALDNACRMVETRDRQTQSLTGTVVTY